MSELTYRQINEIEGIIDQAIRNYWAEDAVKELATHCAENAVNLMLENTIQAKVAGLVEHNPAAVMHHLFGQSGMMVRSKSSKYFDDIIGALLQDETSGIPEAIRNHVKAHLIELIQNAISEIVAGMVVNFMQDNADALATASRSMIERAFQSAKP